NHFADHVVQHDRLGPMEADVSGGARVNEAADSVGRQRAQSKRRFVEAREVVDQVGASAVALDARAFRPSRDPLVEDAEGGGSRDRGAAEDGVAAGEESLVDLAGGVAWRLG